MRTPGRISYGLGIAAMLLLAAPSQAYYHYVHYLQGYGPVPEAYDLTKLPNRTITFFVSNSGPSTYGENDSFNSVLSQVQQAAAAWNSVASSSLRVAFGGLETYSATPNSVTPGGDVVFEELPPGLLGLGSPTVSTLPAGPNATFIPIVRGLVILTNTTDPNAPYGPGPSYLEEFYTTAVHEFGHALGLQHTWTASAMSQDVIRNTSRARPLDADDIASLTELYGAPNWQANTGSISGTVTANGQPWNMASVVAIPPAGPAVSALTNPDGTYTINGLPPGQYMLYAHPLPPDAVPANGTGLALPVDASGKPFLPSTGYFQTVFYSGSANAVGTTNVTEATTFNVAAGQALTGENFAVQPRSSIPIYDVVTYTYLDPVTRTYTYSPTAIWTTPAYASTNPQSPAYLRIFAAANSGATPLPLTATLLGPGTAPSQDTQLWEGYILMDFLNEGGVTPGPRHLAMTFATSQGTDLFVLPDALTVVDNGPPAINSLTQNGDGSLTVAAAGLTADTRVFFDGLPAAVTVPFATTDATDGVVTVMPPQGASGQTSTVTLFTADNQNSMLLQSANPVTYPYPAANAPQIAALNPPALPSGFDVDGTAAMVDITTTNTNFVSGQVTVGFGTSDISVRRVWVLSPTHLVADVVVADNAAIGGTLLVNVISGFQVMSLPGGFQIQAPNTNLPTPALPVYNAVNYATVLHDADYGTIFGTNLALTPTSAQVLLNGTAAPLLYESPTQINFQIPAGFPAGPATMAVTNGAVSAFPVYIQIDSPPALIDVPTGNANASAVSNAAGAAVQAVNPGDIVSVQVTNVDPGIVNTLSSVQVTLSGVPMMVLSVTQVSAAASGQPATAGVFQIQFAVTQSFAGWQVPLVVCVDGSPSLSVPITAR
jgi:uncharacterized protein (TIGR03437 family)